jgi:flagellar motility protein MotE (MotC chaperone)
MKRFYRPAGGPALLICLALLFCAGGSAAEEAGVIFECADVGVEARRILSSLQEAHERVREREKALADRENELKIMEAAVDKKLERLKQLRSDLEQMLAQRDAAKSEKVKKLSKIYQKRDPASAAVSLEAMDRDLAVSILAGMRDKYAGEILDNMDKRKAVIYSTALGRIEK